MCKSASSRKSEKQKSPIFAEKSLGNNLYQELMKQNQFNAIDHSTFLFGREKRLGNNLCQELIKQKQFNTSDHSTFFFGTSTSGVHEIKPV
jgi:hypothetical protein